MTIDTLADQRSAPQTVAVDGVHAVEPFILTLDVGTSSVRGSLYDVRGRVINGLEVQHLHEMTSTPDGGVETDADLLFDRTCRVIDELLQQAGALGQRVAAVAPTTFWHNVLGAGTHGEALTPLYTWADIRSKDAADQLAQVLDVDALHDRTGCFLHPSYLPAKIRWLQHAGTHNVRHWLSFAELMLFRLFGTPQCSISMASGSGLLDQHTCTWDPEVLRAIPLDPSLLSPLADQPLRGLLPPFATRWPALAHTPWYPGWGDGATNNVGSGCVTASQAAMMVGTSGAMRIIRRTANPTIAPKLWCYRVDAARVVVGGALSNGGNVLQWLRTTLHLTSTAPTSTLQDLEDEIAAMEPDSHGLTILPFLAGERSPNWAADARGTISGLRLHTRPVDMLRAGYEAIAYQFGLVYALLADSDRAVRTQDAPPVVASGGALIHSPTWMQMMADVLQSRVVASAVQEASSRGAALLALEALGALPSVEGVAAPTGLLYRPDPAHVPVYRQAAQRQYALYSLLVTQEPRT